MKRNTSLSRAGFSLIEIMVVMSIVLIIATAVISNIPGRIYAGQVEAENIIVDALATDIRRSFEHPDLVAYNLAVTTTDFVSGENPTRFSTADSVPSQSQSNEWFIKLARVRGLTIPSLPIPAASITSDDEIYRMIVNRKGRIRHLFVGPTNEGENLRMVLVSIMGDDHLTLPSYSASAAWFNVWWDTDFDNLLSIPAAWDSGLTTAQKAAWLDGEGDATNFTRVIIRRFTVPRHSITINNNHTSENAYTESVGRVNEVTPAGFGTEVINGVLEGRRITVRVGTSSASATTRYEFVLRKDTTVTVE